jgi:adenosylhomocysteine nucleosidase
VRRPPLVVAAAIGLELRPLLRRLEAVRPDPQLGRGVWRSSVAGRPLLVVRGGVGPERAAHTARLLLSRLGQADGVVNVGIAGALGSDLAIGQVCVPARGADRDGSGGWTAAPALTEFLGGSTGHRAVTIPKPAWTAQAKAALRNASHADLCEMEGTAWAAAAAGRNLPFASVRAISDVADADLPDLGRLGDPGAPLTSLWRLAQPRVWWALPALARNAKTAAEAAAVFLVSNLSRP